jgi:hypothetical protein
LSLERQPESKSTWKITHQNLGVALCPDAEGDVILVTVKREQALWAQYLMLRAGLPLRNGLRSTQPSAPRLPGRRRPQILGFVETLAEAFWSKLGL